MIQRLVVFDTSTYIPYYRGKAYSVYVRRETLRGRVRFCSVVLQELYAGVRSRRMKEDLDATARTFEHRGYLVTPTHRDWITAGLAINRYIRLYGPIEPRDHINDILILLCASWVNAWVLTENREHFEMWAKLLRRMGLRVRIEGLHREDHLN